MKYFKIICTILYRKIWISINRILGKSIVSNGEEIISAMAEVSISSKGKLVLGRRVSIERGSTILVRNTGLLTMGSGIYVNRNCMIACHDKIVIESGVTIGPNCCIYDHDHNLKEHGSFITAPVVIGENTWIGAGVIILKGVCIGKNSVVAAGSVVTRDVPDNTIFYQKREDILKEMN